MHFSSEGADKKLEKRRLLDNDIACWLMMKMVSGAEPLAAKNNHTYGINNETSISRPFLSE